MDGPLPQSEEFYTRLRIICGAKALSGLYSIVLSTVWANSVTLLFLGRECYPFSPSFDSLCITYIVICRIYP